MTILCIRSHLSHIEDAILASLTGDVQMTILCSHPSHTRSSHLQGKGKIFISQLLFFQTLNIGPVPGILPVTSCCQML